MIEKGFWERNGFLGMASFPKDWLKHTKKFSTLFREQNLKTKPEIIAFTIPKTHLRECKYHKKNCYSVLLFDWLVEIIQFISFILISGWDLIVTDEINRLAKGDGLILEEFFCFSN